MNKVSNIFIKIGIGIAANTFVLLSVIFNIWEFLKSIIIRIFTKLPQIFTAFVSVSAFLALIGFIFSTDIFNSNGMKIFCCVILVVVASVLISLSNLIMGIASAFLLIVIELFNTSPIIIFMRDSFMKLVDKYLNYCDSGIRRIEYVYMFGICHILSCFKNLFKMLSVVISILIYPILALACGVIGYWITFIESAAPASGTVEWYINIAYIAIFAIIGICLANMFNFSFKESIEDSDFDLFYIFEIYSNTYKNYFRKKSYSKKNGFNQEEPKEKNMYFDMFSEATTYDEVKKIYRKLAKNVHPDVSELPKEEACKRMADLNKAYEYYEIKYKTTNNK